MAKLNYSLTIEFVIAGISEEEKRRLLHCVIIGGGPTGVEFSGELSDFIMRDVRERYSHVKDYIKVTLIEVYRSNKVTSFPYFSLSNYLYIWMLIFPISIS